MAVSETKTIAVASPQAPRTTDMRGAPFRYLLSASVCLLVAWSFAVPIFEAPDEISHWKVAQYINQHRGLPFYDGRMWDANQPPLYYALMAPFARPSDQPPSGLVLSPQGVQVAMDPPKVTVYSPADFRRFWPIRISRLITALMSVVGVVFCYLAAVEVTGRPITGILAAGLMAFLPQFTFRGMNVSNDALVTTTSAIALYCIMRIVVRGYTARRGIVTAVLIALAFLSKVNAMFLVCTLALAIVSEPSSWLTRFRRLGVFAVSLMIVLPWLIRNQILYGDLLATRQMFQVVPSLIDQKPITSRYFLTTFPDALAKSFVGVFGAMNVWLPPPVYWLFGLLGAVALLGLAWRLVRRRVGLRPILILFTAPVLVLAMTVQLNLTFSQPQGRYLFPALSAVAVLAAIGLEGIPLWRPSWTYVFTVLFAVCNVAILCALVVPTYWYSNSPILKVMDVVVSESLMRKTAGPLKDGGSFVQTFISRADNLSSVEVEMATWRKLIPSGWLHMRLLERTKAQREIASWRVPLRRVKDNSFVALEFPPIPDSKGKAYSIVMETEQMPPGYAITVWLTDGDVYPDGEFLLDGGPLGCDTSFRTYFSPNVRD
jgi:4-amino-4-deoxy-L-arabinose transferase-like glycosyltransferase